MYGKKLAAFLLTFVAAMFLCAGALGEISVGKRDLNLNGALDKNVSNILILLQDGEETDTVMIASINGKSGRSVMTRVNALEAEIQEMDGACQPIETLYALGEEGSGGYLVCRELNEALELNISTYVALDIARLPELAEHVGALNIDLDAQEAEALGAWEGRNELQGDAILDYVRLRLEGDSPARSRGYDALMQLLYQGLHSGNVMDMMSLGSKLLASMDTNLNPLQVMTLVSAVQAGTDRRELLIDVTVQGEEAVETLHREIYE